MLPRAASPTRVAAPAAVGLMLTCAVGAPAALAGQVGGHLEVGLHGGSISHSLLGLVNGTLLGLGGPNGLGVDARVEAEPSALLEGLVRLRITPTFSTRVRAARTTTHMRLIADTQPVGGAGQRFTFDGLGEVAAWLADVDVAWAPWGPDRPLSPFLFVGIGVSHWDITGLEDIEALPPLLESPLNLVPVHAYLPGVVVGIGLALVSFGPLTVEVEVADHMSGDPIADDDFRIGAEFVGSGRAKDLVHNLSLTGGGRVRLGG